MRMPPFGKSARDDYLRRPVEKCAQSEKFNQMKMSMRFVRVQSSPLDRLRRKVAWVLS
jgi:hypothetical protein